MLDAKTTTKSTGLDDSKIHCLLVSHCTIIACYACNYKINVRVKNITLERDNAVKSVHIYIKDSEYLFSFIHLFDFVYS